MVDIQFATAEIRRGKKKIETEQCPHLLRRVAIIMVMIMIITTNKKYE